MKLRSWLLPLVVAAACQSVPGTGRTRLAPTMTLDEQVSLGIQAYDEALADAKIIKTGPQAEMVRRVGQRLVASHYARQLFPDQISTFQWEFKLVDAPDTLNAWVLPGGKCAVYSGILKVTQSEDALAVVMGHEMAHALAEHGPERIAQAQLSQLGYTVGSIVLDEYSVQGRQEILALAGLGVQYGILMPFSRTHESEADELGLYFAADAGYDPRTAIGLWERMAQMGGSGTPEWLSTHPSESTRIERLQKAMPKAMELYEASKSAAP